MNTKICPACKTPIPANAPGGLCPACILRDADEPAPAGRAAPALAEIASAFPQLEIESLIGQGGMGFVYKVRQPSLDRTVALKILSPELGRDPAFAECFAREARVLGKLNHPNIVTVFEHGTSGGFFYLLMEFVDGVNLRQAMRAGRFTPQQALGVVPGICDALQAAHAQGVWHRDIKPENILLDAQGGVKIVDFGIARIVGDPGRDFTLTATGAALGSAAYMAPEQHEKPHDVDHRADIYSLGVVIYEMLTGELPLGRFPAPSERAAVSARIDEIVLQTLEKERSLRQQSAEEVKTEVARAAPTAGERAPVRSEEEPTPITKWSIGLALGGIVMFGAASVFTHGSTQGVLLTFAIVAIVLGFIGACIALAKMRRDQIPPIWRPGLRVLVWSPVVASVMFVFAAGLWIMPMRRGMAAMHAERDAMRAAMAQAEAELQRRQASNTGLPEPQQISPQTDAKSAAPVPSKRRVVITPSPAQGSVADPGVPRVAQMEDIEVDTSNPRGGDSPLETILRMNELANANDKEGFKRYLAMNVSGARSEVERYVAERLDVFTGKIVGVWRTGAEKRLGAQPDRRAPQPMYWFEREREGKRIFIQCFISVEKGRCLNFSQMSAPYRATARVEFRPAEGDPLRILRGVLPENSAFEVEQFFADAAPVAGQFNARSYAVPLAEVAAAKANELTQLIGDRLKALGQGSTYRVIKAATVPERPEFFTMPNLEQLFPESAKNGQ